MPIPEDRDDALRAAFIAFMHLFGSAQLLLKDRMRGGDAGLGPLQLRLLCLCAERPGSSQQQLADALGRDKGQVAHLIHALEDRGLVVRKADAADARLLRMQVTPAGVEQAQGFIALETEVARQLFGGLDPQQEQLLQALLDQLRTRISSPAHSARAPAATSSAPA